MATNLHAMIRYRAIDRSLRRKGKLHTWVELADACAEAIYEATGVNRTPSRRTIMYDIDNMRSGKLGYEAPIEFDRASGTYFYSDSAFSISNSPLSEADVQELNHALAILRQFQGFGQVSALEDIVTRLEEALRVRQDDAKTVIHFDRSEGYTGECWLHSLYKAALASKPVTLEYQPFGVAAPYRTTVSPYLLKQYNLRWFLIAWNHERHEIQHYSLDRIQSAEEALLAKFYQAPAFSSKTYFSDIIGVSLNPISEKETILLEASALQAKYIKTKPIHKSQQIVQEDETKTIFSLELIPNFELESLILSFGEQVRVIGPEELRGRVEKRLEMAWKRNR